MSGLILVLAVLLCVGSLPANSQERADSASGAAVTGIVTQRLHDYKIGWVSEPAPKEPVRLCSPDRVVETETDQQGEFRFTNVPPGLYDVVTAGRLYPPATVRAVQVGIRGVSALNITEGVGPARQSPCVKRQYDCSPKDWFIEYDAPANQRSAVVYGVVKQRAGPLSQAWIAVFHAGETTRVAGRFTDSHGRFEFLLPPGYYKLQVSRKGFQRVDVATFLAPLSNRTKLTISTLPMGERVGRK